MSIVTVSSHNEFKTIVVTFYLRLGRDLFSLSSRRFESDSLFTLSISKLTPSLTVCMSEQNEYQIKLSMIILLYKV